MNAHDIKQWIVENKKIPELLEDLGCQHVKYHSDNYITCANPPPGDNKQAVTVYLPNLNVVNYTRDLPQPSDIFTLVEYYKNINFFYSLRYVCELFGLDLYKDINADLPESLKITKMLKRMNSGETENDQDTPIKVIPDSILSYYRPFVNDFWLKDGVHYDVQREWELGYDEYTNRITIPIRDELGNLCGVKGRIFKKEITDDELKYYYLEPCPRRKILYGLYKTFSYIKESNWAYIGEAEKFCHQLWSYGYKNSVATSGDEVSDTQIEKLSRLGVPVCFAFDQDITQEKIEKIAKRFIEGIEVWAIYDKGGILEAKESPSDNLEKWKHLVKNNVYKIR
ncbi:MAG TPA: DNA primase [Spirochaetia bacterium]|nr:DNA primase [Spirochaetia bacterium]